MKTEYLLHREVEHVLAALMPVNRVVMRVCIHTGLRVGDVLALRTDQIAPRFWVTEQKTKKRRIVGLPSDLLAKYGDIAKVQRALNHSGPSVTMIYAMADQLYRQKYHKKPHEA